MIYRRDGIRTHGLFVPNEALYQTEPHAVTTMFIILRKQWFVNREFAKYEKILTRVLLYVMIKSK